MDDYEKKIKQIIKVFSDNGLSLARMFGSKTRYREAYPEERIYFNANVIIKSLGKVWYGDIHIEKDEGALRDVAKELGETVFILREMDGRFGTEEKPIDELIKLAVWNTEII